MIEQQQSAIASSVNIINARVPGYDDLHQIGIRDGKVKEIVAMSTVFKWIPQTDVPFIDIAGDWISLGGVDLQINGALGLAFTDVTLNDRDRLIEICQFLWTQGVDGFLPTLVTTSLENIERSLAVFADLAYVPSRQGKPTAQMWGVHLEGPFLNPEKRGAHPDQYLLPLTIENVKRVLGDYANIVKIITLAPELDPTGEVIAYLNSKGIVVSLGHSLATAAQAQKAFEQGACMVTHAFNAMPPLHHREPGLLGAAIVDPKVQCGLIADGQHVSPIMIQLLLRASQHQEGIFLVSDALAPLGLPDGIYPWDEREIEVKDGTARLLNGTLAGTTLPLLAGVKNLVKWGLCDVESAIALATEAPRRPLERAGILGKLAVQLLCWHQEPDTQELTWQRLFTA